MDLNLSHTLMVMFINLCYSITAIGIGVVAMKMSYHIFDKLLPFDTGELLKENPIATSIFAGCVVLGVGICSGLIIGLSTN